MNKEGFFRFGQLRSAQGRARLAVVLGGLAMLLILLSELWPQAEPAPQAETDSREADAYCRQLEQQLEELISQMEGAGRTKVMVTLETGEETIYAMDTQTGQTQSGQTHVLLEDGTALARTVCLPRVCGVAVVCDGGGDVRVAARITELVSALLDLSSNRICVEQRSG